MPTLIVVFSSQNIFKTAVAQQHHPYSTNNPIHYCPFYFCTSWQTTNCFTFQITDQFLYYHNSQRYWKKRFNNHDNRLDKHLYLS